MNSQNTPTILYVDDEQTSLSAFTASFRRDFEIYTAQSGHEAIQILEEKTISVLISDLRMPGMEGTFLLQEAVKKYSCQSRILISAFIDRRVLDIAVHKCHIFAYLQKPWDHDHLKQIILEAHDAFLHKCEFKSVLANREKIILQLDKSIKNALTEPDT